MKQQIPDLIGSKNHGQPGRPLGKHLIFELNEFFSDSLPIMKQQGVQGLIIRGAGTLFRGQMGQENGNMLCIHVARMLLFMKIGKALDPVYICLFGPNAVMLNPYRIADLIQQPRRGRE
jgi:hypothetical protein